MREKEGDREGVTPAGWMKCGHCGVSVYHVTEGVWGREPP